MRYRSACSPLPPLAACQPAAPDPRGVDRDETLLTVSATGRADTRPDEARLQLGVQSHRRQRRPKRAAPTARRWPRSTAALGHARGQARRPPDPQPDPAADRLWPRARPLPRRQCGRGQAARHGPGRRSGGRGDRGRRQCAGGPDLRISDRESGQPLGLCRRLSRRAGAGRGLCRRGGLKIDRVLAIHDGGE